MKVTHRLFIKTVGSPSENDRRHTGERPFGCLKCGKRYFRKENLLVHEFRDCARVQVSEEASACLRSLTRVPPNTLNLFVPDVSRHRSTPVLPARPHLPGKKSCGCTLSLTPETCPTRSRLLPLVAPQQAKNEPEPPRSLQVFRLTPG